MEQLELRCSGMTFEKPLDGMNVGLNIQVTLPAAIKFPFDVFVLT